MHTLAVYTGVVDEEEDEDNDGASVVKKHKAVLKIITGEKKDRISRMNMLLLPVKAKQFLSFARNMHIAKCGTNSHCEMSVESCIHFCNTFLEFVLSLRITRHNILKFVQRQSNLSGHQAILNYLKTYRY